MDKPKSRNGKFEKKNQTFRFSVKVKARLSQNNLQWEQKIYFVGLNQRTFFKIIKDFHLQDGQ